MAYIQVNLFSDMVRADNAKNIIANGAISYIINKLNRGLSDFNEELDNESKLDATYVAARDGAAKTKIDQAIKMLRWLYETEFTQTPPAPYSDAEVDTIDPEIRTFEDGL